MNKVKSITLIVIQDLHDSQFGSVSINSRLEDVDQLVISCFCGFFIEYMNTKMVQFRTNSALLQHSNWLGNCNHCKLSNQFACQGTSRLEGRLVMDHSMSHGTSTKCSIEQPKLNIYENSWTSWYLLKLTIIMVDQETLSTCTFGKITRPDRKVILNIISHIYLTKCDITSDIDWNYVWIIGFYWKYSICRNEGFPKL